jgi:hypothetical protein
MANVKLVFCGDEQTENTKKEMQVYINQYQKIYIQIDDTSERTQGWDSLEYIVLDKITAIRFSKELRKQIALID